MRTAVIPLVFVLLGAWVFFTAPLAKKWIASANRWQLAILLGRDRCERHAERIERFLSGVSVAGVWALRVIGGAWMAIGVWALVERLSE
jgi:hypothetical protein